MRRALVMSIAAAVIACGDGEPPPPSQPTPTPDPGALPAKKTASLGTGIQMAYFEMGSASGETLLFLHGLTDSSRSFHPTMGHLTKLRPDLRLVSVDQRGHGASSMPDPEQCRSAPEKCFRPADYCCSSAGWCRRIMPIIWSKRSAAWIPTTSA